MAKKETYEAPQTQMSEVELEQGFMNASLVQQDEHGLSNTNVTSGEQEIADNFDFTASEWE